MFEEIGVAEALLVVLSVYKKSEGSMELGESADMLATAAEDALKIIMEIRPDLTEMIKLRLNEKVYDILAICLKNVTDKINKVPPNQYC